MKSLSKSISSENKMRTKLLSTSSAFSFRGRKQKRFQGRKLRTDQEKYEEDGVQKMGRSMFSQV